MLRRRRLQGFMTLVLLALCVLPVLLLGVVASRTAAGIIQKNNRAIALQNLKNMSQIESTRILGLTNLFNYIRQKDDIARLLSSSAHDKAAWSAVNTQIRTNIDNDEIALQSDYPFEYLFIDAKGNVYAGQRTLTWENQGEYLSQIQAGPWEKAVENVYVEKLYIGVGEKITDENYKPQRVYLAGNILRSSQNIGTLFIGVASKYLWGGLAGAGQGESSSVFILDDNARLVVQGQNNQVAFDRIPENFWQFDKASGYRNLEGRELLVLTDPIELSGLSRDVWHMVSVTPVSVINRDVNWIMLVTALLVALCIAAAGIYALIIRHAIFRPLERLTSFMGSVLEGDLDPPIPEEGAGEIRQLYAGFGRMQRQLKRYIEDIRVQQRAEREMEIKFLQAQINPHFICNALNTIRVMADMNHAPGVSKAVKALNNLVAHYLRDGRSILPLREEVDYLREYLYLQKLRYFNSFTFQIDLAEDVENLGIMKLILQPFVENSIHHGFADPRRQGELIICAWRANGFLAVTIRDNGAGFSAEALKAPLDASEKDNPGHIGIRNVLRRIQNAYGAEYGITLENPEEGGALVTIRLPLLNAEGGETN